MALFDAATPVIQGHPILGPLVFIGLCALSAMLAFFSSALFVPMAAPSEAAAHLLGMARIRWSLFVAAIAVAQLPFALVSVLVGESFLQRQVGALVLLGVGSLLLSAVALRVLHRGAALRSRM